MPSTGIEPTRYGESTLHSSDVEFDYYTKEKEGCSNSAYKLAVPQIYWESSQLWSPYFERTDSLLRKKRDAAGFFFVVVFCIRVFYKDDKQMCLWLIFIFKFCEIEITELQKFVKNTYGDYRVHGTKASTPIFVGYNSINRFDRCLLASILNLIKSNKFLTKTKPPIKPE